MLPYIILILLIIIINIKYLGKHNKYAAYLVMFFIAFITCFRDKTVGIDTISYVNYFLKPYLGYANDTREFEYLFQEWCTFIKQVWPNGNFFIFIPSLYLFFFACSLTFSTNPIPIKRLIKEVSP